MFVEYAVSAQGPISLIVSPSITVAELKQQVEEQFEIPVAVQKWILDKSLVSEDGVTLSSQGVDKDGARVYLYLVSPEEAALPAPAPAPVSTTSSAASGFNKGPAEPVQKGRYWNYEEDRWSVCNSDEDDDEAIVEANNKTKEVAVNGNGAAKPQNFQFIAAPKEVEAALEAVKEDADKEVKNVEEAGKEEEGEWEYYYEEEPEKPKEETKAKPDIEKLVAEHVAERKREAAVPVATDGEEAGGWVCPVCTLRNPLERPGCQACTTERPADIGAGAVQQEEVVPVPRVIQQERQIEIVET